MRRERFLEVLQNLPTKRKQVLEGILRGDIREKIMVDVGISEAALTQHKRQLYKDFQIEILQNEVDDPRAGERKLPQLIALFSKFAPELISQPAVDRPIVQSFSDILNATNKPSIIRQVRLRADANQMFRMFNLLQDSSDQTIRIENTEGEPPEKYLLSFSMNGVIGIDEIGKPRMGDNHVVEITVHDNYPMSMPFVRFYTPLFHPNIYEEGTVCLGWFPIPYQLPDICIHIAKMIDYQVYNLTASANSRAANWAAQNENLFPLQSWNMSKTKIIEGRRDTKNTRKIELYEVAQETVMLNALVVHTGRRCTTEVSTDILVGVLKQSLIEHLQLPTKLKNGWPTEYVLKNRTQNCRLQDNLTLHESGVQDSDDLVLAIEVEAG